MSKVSSLLVLSIKTIISSHKKNETNALIEKVKDKSLRALETFADGLCQLSNRQLKFSLKSLLPLKQKTILIILTNTLSNSLELNLNIKNNIKFATNQLLQQRSLTTGKTVLHEAAELGKTETVRLLLKSGANKAEQTKIERQDIYGPTALVLAIVSGKLSTILELLGERPQNIAALEAYWKNFLGAIKQCEFFSIPCTATLKPELEFKGIVASYFQGVQLKTFTPPVRALLKEGIQFISQNPLAMNQICKNSGFSLSRYCFSEGIYNELNQLENCNIILTDGENSKELSLPFHSSYFLLNSPFFRTMVTSGMKETHSSEISSPTIHTELSPSALCALKEYICSQEIKDLTPSIAWKLILFANLWELPRLKGYCEYTLFHSLEKDDEEEMEQHLILAKENNALSFRIMHVAEKLNDRAVIQVLNKSFSTPIRKSEAFKIDTAISVSDSVIRDPFTKISLFNNFYPLVDVLNGIELKQIDLLLQHFDPQELKLLFLDKDFAALPNICINKLSLSDTSKAKLLHLLIIDFFAARPPSSLLYFQGHLQLFYDLGEGVLSLEEIKKLCMEQLPEKLRSEWKNRNT